MHLIIDGYVTDPKKIEDKEFIYNFLDTYPPQIKMTKVSVPQVSEHDIPRNAEEGISGFVLLAESHISVHVYPERSYVNLDIFSCREFDVAQATQALEQQFGLTNITIHTLDRPHPDLA